MNKMFLQHKIKYFALVVLFFTFGNCFADAKINRNILGTWRYTHFFYEGHLYEAPNPDLMLTFAFFENGKNRLHWETNGERGFCDRTAKYKVINGETLIQEIDWVNPKNKFECGRDSDMQLGKKFTNKFKVKKNQLHLYLQLNGKDFIYILTKLGSQQS